MLKSRSTLAKRLNLVLTLAETALSVPVSQEVLSQLASKMYIMEIDNL